MFPAPAPRPLNLGLGRASLGMALVPDVGSGELGADAIERDDAFFTWLFMQAGVRARHYRPSALRRRLPACLRALRVENTRHARRLLRHHPHLIPTALDALLLGVTEFFRDTQVFENLQRELSGIAENRRPLRVWSAGCSDGAELYSIAMLLAELNVLEQSELRGTDCRQDAIARASAGVYQRCAMGGVSTERMRAHFQPVAGNWRIAPALRERIAWRCADLLAAVEPGPWDVIFCRNLAMYLQPSATERLWRNLTSALRPGGLLVLGKAERPSGGLSLAAVGPCLYRRQGGA